MKTEKAVRIKKQLENLEKKLDLDSMSNNAFDEEIDPVESSKLKIRKIRSELRKRKEDSNLQKEINNKLKNIAKIFVKEMEK